MRHNLLACLATITVLFVRMMLCGDPLPVRYDLRDVNGVNYVSSVKSQQGGTCWTHGSVASAESNLMMTGKWQIYGETGEPNLAEYHLDWWNGFNQFNNDDLAVPDGSGLEVHRGGDYLITTAYIARGEGMVRDSDGQAFDTNPPRDLETYHGWTSADVAWYTIDDSLNGIDRIKQALINRGAVATCIAWDRAFIDDNLNFYQPPDSLQEPNHSVTIVGWDDVRPTQAPYPGAWIVKNSWAETWGQGGYFWISYYDKLSCRHPEMGAVSFADIKPRYWDAVFSHDYHGWRATLTGVREGFNVFTADSLLQLEHVGFYTTEPNVEYRLRVYGGFNGSEPVDILTEYTGLAETRGLHVVELPDPAYIDRNQTFCLYLSVSGGGLAYDRTSEVSTLLGGDSRTLVPSIAHPGESFYRFPDQQWTDFYNYPMDNPLWQGTGNLCIIGYGVFKSETNRPPVITRAIVSDFTDLDLAWSRPVGTSGHPVSYGLYRNDEMLDEFPDAPWRIINPVLTTQPESVSEYRIDARFTTGLPTNASVTVNFDFPKPLNLQIDLEENGVVNLGWTVGQIRGRFHRVYRNGTVIATCETGSYRDSLSLAGVYRYWVTSVYGSVESDPTNEVVVRYAGGMWHHSLISVSPNPFSDHLFVNYQLASDTKVDIELFNIRGQKVRHLVSGLADSGGYLRLWDGRDDDGTTVSAGVYVLRFRAGGTEVVKKVTLIR